MASWAEQRQALLDGGFTEADVAQHEQDQRQTLFQGGFSNQEIDEHFGVKKFDKTNVESYFQEGMRKYAAEQSQQPQAEPLPMGQAAPHPTAEIADTFLEAIQAGYQMSVTGLFARGKMPDITLSEDAGMFYRIMSQIGSLAGDIPAMLAGGVAGSAAGGAAGSAIPVVGNALGVAMGSGAGGFALPSAMRQYLMDSYEKGDVTSFSDFWERSAAVFIEGLKGGVIGAATAGAGKYASRLVRGAEPLVEKGIIGAIKKPVTLSEFAAVGASEVATMVTIGKALEGEVPGIEDFTEAAILIGGMHAIAPVSKTLRTVYAKYNKSPAEVALTAKENPRLKQELLSEKPNEKIIAEELSGEKFGPEPQTWYHGTKSDITEFDPSFLGSNTKAPSAREGYFFTNDPEIAGQYADIAGSRLVAQEAKLKSELESLNKYGIKDADTLDNIYHLVRRFPEETTFEGRRAAAQKQPVKAFTPENLVEHSVEKLTIEQAREIHFRYKKVASELEAVRNEMRASKEHHYSGETVYPAHLKLENPFIKDFKGEPYRETSYKDLIKEAKAKGHDGVIFKNTYDSPFDNLDVKPHDVAVVFDNKQIKFKHLGNKIDAFGEIPAKAPEKLGPNDERSATRKILDQVGGEKPPKPGAKNMKEWVNNRKLDFRKWYTDFVDKLDPIKQAVNYLSENPKALLDSKNPYSLARMAGDFAAKVKHVLERGTIDFKTLEVNGKSFKEILTPFKNEIEDFKAFVISKRVLEIEGRNVERLKSKKKPIEHGFDVEAAKEVVKNGEKRYAEAAKELTEFQNRNLKYLLDSERISQDQFDAFTEANKNYVPFSRVLEMIGGVEAKGASAGFLKSMTGSRSKIVDPFQAMVENAETLMRLAEKNRAVKELVKMDKDGILLEKVDAQARVTEISIEELQKFLDDNGIDGIADKTLKAIRHQGKLMLKENEFEVWNKGKREVYAAPVELATAIKALNGNTFSTNLFMKQAQRITKMLKFSITLTPEFIIRNFLRDQLTSGVFAAAKNMPGHIADTVIAMGDIIGQTEAYYSWLKSGGAGGAFMELGNKYLKDSIYQLEKQTGIMGSLHNVIKHPIQHLELAARIAEESTRLAEHKRVTKGATGGDVLFKGGMASREITIDFQRMGAKVAAFNAITAFQNVAIQGVDRTARAIKDNPQGVLASGALLTAASTALYWANHDEPWYKEINRWEKDLFWHIKLGDTIFRLPKPQELGIFFGSVPERMLEGFLGDNPRAWRDFDETVKAMLLPSLIPDVMAAPMEQWANKSMFTGNPVVSQSVEQLLPPFQFTEYTSETAKLLSKLIGVFPPLAEIGPDNTKLASPMVVDHYIRSWTGTMGQYAVFFADKALTGLGIVPDLKPENTLADIPFIKAFVSRYPAANAQSIKDFRSNFKEASRITATIKALGRRGSFTDQMKVVEEHQGSLIKMQGMNQALSNISRTIQLVHQNPKMSADEKRNQITTMYQAMIMISRQGNVVYDAIQKDIKAAKRKK